MDLLTFFAFKQYAFHDDNLRSIMKRMSQADEHAFQMDIKKIDWIEYLHTMVLGMRLYIAKDEINTIPTAKKRMRKLVVAHFLLKYALFAFIIYYSCTTIFTLVSNHL